MLKFASALIVSLGMAAPAFAVGHRDEHPGDLEAPSPTETAPSPTETPSPTRS